MEGNHDISHSQITYNPGMDFLVVTTVRNPSAPLEQILESPNDRQSLIVVGDAATPSAWFAHSDVYLPLDQQQTMDYRLGRQLPVGSYSRKMIGYLEAARRGAARIRETDDDNWVLPIFASHLPEILECRLPSVENGWVNPYTWFCDEDVWPRGFPLELIGSQSASKSIGTPDASFIPTSDAVVQFITDGDPDVDAVFRLTRSSTLPIEFQRRRPIVIPSGSWAPFNSQATSWPRTLLPLMYLPSTCSFRMTDIWRSFIAQRIMWSGGHHLIFSGPGTLQIRNEHDLLSDFEQEFEGYCGYQRLTKSLEMVDLNPQVEALGKSLLRCYEILLTQGFFEPSEMDILKAWLSDVNDLG